MGYETDGFEGRADGVAAHELERFRRFRSTGDRALRNALIDDYRWLALQCARRFARRGEPMDDLVQVAMLGVFKAVERFDPEFGTPFVAYAAPTVLGELRRHFRDTTWSVKVPRRAHDLHAEVTTVVEELTHRLRRAPTLDEIAEWMNVSVDRVHDALEAGLAYRTTSLDLVHDGHADLARDANAGVDDAVVDRVAVRRLMADLPVRDRTIVFLRYFEGLSQAEVAARVGISQVHVSRLLRTSLQRISRKLDAEPSSAAGPEPVHD